VGKCGGDGLGLAATRFNEYVRASGACSGAGGIGGTVVHDEDAGFRKSLLVFGHDARDGHLFVEAGNEDGEGRSSHGRAVESRIGPVLSK
jgi:hypothetical protein